MAATLTRPPSHRSRPDPLRAGRRPPRSPPWPQRSLVHHLMGHARTRSARAAARLVHRRCRNAHSSVISWVTPGPAPRGPPPASFTAMATLTRPSSHGSRPDPLRAGCRPPRSPSWPQRSLVHHLMGHVRTRSVADAASFTAIAATLTRPSSHGSRPDPYCPSLVASGPVPHVIGHVRPRPRVIGHVRTRSARHGSRPDRFRAGRDARDARRRLPAGPPGSTALPL